MSEGSFNDRSEHELGPEPDPEPQRASPRPVHVAPLEYEPRRLPAVLVSTRWQFLAGMLWPYICGGAIAAAVANLPWQLGEALLYVGICVFVAMAALLRIKAKWTGFIPGILTGIFVAPLVAIVLCGMITAGFKFGMLY